MEASDAHKLAVSDRHETEFPVEAVAAAAEEGICMRLAPQQPRPRCSLSPSISSTEYMLNPAAANETPPKLTAAERAKMREDINRNHIHSRVLCLPLA